MVNKDEYIKLAISLAFERTSIYRIVSYRIVCVLCYAKWAVFRLLFSGPLVTQKTKIEESFFKYCIRCLSWKSRREITSKLRGENQGHGAQNVLATRFYT